MTNRKRWLALLLIGLLAVSCIGCGQEGGQQGENPSENPGNEALGGEDPTGEDPSGDDDFYEEEEMTPYQFHGTIAEDFAFRPLIDKTDYDDIESLAPVLEDTLRERVEAVLGGSYEYLSMYEEEEEDDFDTMSYAMAEEEGETEVEGRFLETGVYHSQSRDGYYHYIMFTSEDFYEGSEAEATALAALMEKAMGVTLSPEVLMDVMKQALAKAPEAEDLWSFKEVVTRTGDGYEETVTMHVDGIVWEEDSPPSCYMTIERERRYS